MIPEKNRLAKHNEYFLFVHDRARAHSTKLTLEMLKDKKQPWLLVPRHEPPNSPDLNLVDFEIWGPLELNAYRCQRIPGLDSLKEAILEEWNKIPLQIIRTLYRHI